MKGDFLMPDLFEEGSSGSNGSSTHVLPSNVANTSTKPVTDAVAPSVADAVTLQLGTAADVVRALRETLEDRDARWGVESCVFLTFLAQGADDDLDDTAEVVRDYVVSGRGAGSESFLLSLLSRLARTSPRTFVRIARALDGVPVATPRGRDFFCDAGLDGKLLLSPLSRNVIAEIFARLARTPGVVDVGRLVRELANQSRQERDGNPGAGVRKPISEFDRCVADWTRYGGAIGAGAGGIGGGVGGMFAGASFGPAGMAIGAAAGWVAGASAGALSGYQGGAAAGEKLFCIGKDRGGRERTGAPPLVGYAGRYCLTIDPTNPPHFPWPWPPPWPPRPRPMPSPLPVWPPIGTTPPFVPPRFPPIIRESSAAGDAVAGSSQIEQLASELYLVHGVLRTAAPSGE